MEYSGRLDMGVDSKGRDSASRAIADTDVAVVGGGIAGMSAALESIRQGARTVLITDRALGRSNSVLAQGGIQLPRNDPVDIELTLADARRVGQTDFDDDRLMRFVAELPGLLDQLEDWGLSFDRDERGELIRRLAGGLSSPRVATIGDQIGRPLVRVLKERLQSRCKVLDAAPVHRVDIHDRFHLSTAKGGVSADAVVVATGGVAYQEALDTGSLTSNPPNHNARLRNSLVELGLEEPTTRRFQWHPFGLLASRKGVTLSCVPESVAALGPKLVADGGEICGLPAPRAQIVAAMTEVSATGAEVRLTLSKLRDDVLAGFPKVERLMRRYGSDPVVVPALHYELSGYPTRADQSTVVDGLFLAGEIVGGIHGRERLMGTGVADSLIHGRRAGMSAGRYVRER